VQTSRIAIVGTGYVGLTTGACLASLGHQVVCIDNDESKIQMLRACLIPIFEDGLESLVESGLSSGNLAFSTELISSVEVADFTFLCLPTPPNNDGTADLTTLFGVLHLLKGKFASGSIVINKSTVPVNSAGVVAQILAQEVPVVSNPEFLREGSAVHDFLHPDRILIGCDDLNAGKKVAALYSSLNCPVVFTDPLSAESVKYLANAFLAMKISFVNQSALFCDAVGSNVLEVMRGLSFDPRIGSMFLNPGPGWGGSCFPKDTQALTGIASASGEPMSLVSEAIATNEKHIHRSAQLIIEAAQKNESTNVKVAILGLSFKADTDDTRESPALKILQIVQDSFENVVAYDPQAKVQNGVVNKRVNTMDEALLGADVVAILTEWNEFRNLDPIRARNLMRGNVFVDLRYLLNKDMFRKSGFSVRAFGN
jgi:UDPglucose 6-dehydrogenase